MAHVRQSIFAATTQASQSIRGIRSIPAWNCLDPHISMTDLLGHPTSNPFSHAITSQAYDDVGRKPVCILPAYRLYAFVSCTNLFEKGTMDYCQPIPAKNARAIVNHLAMAYIVLIANGLASRDDLYRIALGLHRLSKNLEENECVQLLAQIIPDVPKYAHEMIEFNGSGSTLMYLEPYYPVIADEFVIKEANFPPNIQREISTWNAAALETGEIDERATTILSPVRPK